MNPEVQLIFDFMLFTPGQRTAFAIRCAMAVYKEESFVQWANGWLSGSDRSEEAKGRHAVWAITRGLLSVRITSRGAAWGAAWAAASAGSWPGRGPSAAVYVTDRAAEVADQAVKANPSLNLTAIAEEVMATHKASR